MPLLQFGCSTNAATGRSQFNTLSRDEEIALGSEAMPALIDEYGGRYPVGSVDSYVSEVGMKLAATVEDPEKQSLPWEFTVLDSDVINAFALPGGKVFISRGLLAQLDNEAELAGVLGHEVGHVTAEHAEQRMGQQTIVSVGAAVAGAVAGVFGGASAGTLSTAAQTVVGTGGQGFLLKFSRDQESESDALGIRYMVAAGYDPAGMVGVLEVLKAASEGGSNAEILSTHPYPETRLDRVETLLNTEYPGKRGNPALKTGVTEWNQRIRSTLPKPAVARLDGDCWCGQRHAAVESVAKPVAQSLAESPAQSPAEDAISAGTQPRPEPKVVAAAHRE